MLRSTLLLGVVFGAIVGFSALARDKPVAESVVDQAPPPRLVIKPKTKPRPVLIAAELNRAHVYPGDTVRLTELVPTNREIRINRYDHTVHLIGQYDFTSHSLVNRDPEKALFWAGGLVFDEWRGSAMAFGNKHFQFDVTNPRQEGLEFEFKARQVGIYLIKAEWKLSHSEDVIESNPVILTVSPPLDKDGKPIIKEEWIDPITWKHRLK